jgi:hypothetical protein
MEFDWGYFFSLFSVGAFWQACVTVIVVSSLSWFIGLVLGFFSLREALRPALAEGSRRTLYLVFPQRAADGAAGLCL